ncbi:helix-turn-helix domain-containing protein [Arcobacter aquimarinus]|uniref:Transcriptional regulator, XRE family n=1 Tax=Arcobacter aquimarinus TaxID=1315211 RepID=A0AAE7B4U3_9BACT|nr:helix-turn-helix transcriptional regulator [Arcobacter aquimarinus]QKE26571.1 transcriptional regulator, XRE family [Arcobacter aquimarinus]RXI34166.1 transcriptional regulator [Arcobacter aquimarinus]
MFEENPEYFLDKVVEKVKQERNQRKISQLKLANILNFSSPNYIAKIETRKHGVNYNLVHLCKIAKAFNMEVVDFLPKK